MTIAAGTQLTCTNPDCGCRLRVEEPCPHGDDFTCGCGHQLVAAPDAGGELVVHNARFGEGAGKELAHLERTGSAALDAIAACGQVIPRMDVGDIIVFDSGRHFHRVTEVSGPHIRWTMGGFLARSLDDRSVYYWS